MKRAFLLLLIVLFYLYGKLGYELVKENFFVENTVKGCLTDIADEVTAIPLHPIDDEIKNITNLYQEGDNLFLISNRILYRFDNNGQFICRITNPERIEVANYMVDSLHQRLIVLGNVDDVHFYSFNGDLLETKKMQNESPYYRILSANMIRQEVWITEECAFHDSDTGSFCIQKQVVRYDSSFNKISAYPLFVADLSEKEICRSFGRLELGIDKDSGKVYAYAPPLSPDNLLRDTLLLKRKELTSGNSVIADEITIYPFRFGQRFWIASSYPYDTEKSYTYCFDQRSNKSWQLAEGFEDDFYHTGSISELRSMDIYNNTCYFSKAGNEVKESLIENMNVDNPVIFIVKLKS